MPRTNTKTKESKIKGAKIKIKGAKIKGSKTKRKARVKATKSKKSGTNGKTALKQLKTEIKKPRTAATKSNASAKGKAQKKNTVTLIRSTRIEKKRKVVKIEKSDFVNNRFKLDDDSYIMYFPRFLTKKKQNEILTELVGTTSLDLDAKQIKKSNIPWQHGYYSMYGKSIPTPRLLYAMRDEDQDITNSYTVTGSMPWTPEIENLRNRITKKIGKRCRYAQMNMYRTGDDYIGFHTDSEVEPGDMIASVSIGAERTFRFISKNFKEDALPLYTMTLEPGSLLIMSEYAAKHNWKHELPKDSGVDEMRINITFRPN